MSGSRESSHAQALAGAIGLVRGKWAIGVLASLAGGPLRQSDLLAEVNQHHRAPGEGELSLKVLIETMRQLRQSGLVENHRQGDKFAAESWYTLTRDGRTFIVASRPLVKWFQARSMRTGEDDAALDSEQLR